MKSLYDLKKYAETGIAAPGMTASDKMRALSAFGGFPVKTITGVPPLTFQSDGTALTAWSISGNMTQTGTPTPSEPITPEETGDKTGNLFDADTIYSNFKIADNEFKSTAYNFYNIKAYLFSQSDIGKTFTFSVTFSNNDASNMRVSANINGIERNGNFINSSEGTSTITFTVSTENDYIFINYGSGGNNNVTVSDIMLNTGSTALPYEPFGYKIPITLAGQTQTIYLDEPLRKALDGSDAVDVLRSDGTLTRAVDSDGNALQTPTTETVTVPTLTPQKGSNTLTVDTDLQPSEVSITGGIK